MLWSRRRKLGVVVSRTPGANVEEKEEEEEEEEEEVISIKIILIPGVNSIVHIELWI